MSSESVPAQLPTHPFELSPHQVLFRPGWVPEHGHAPAKVGIYFGAVRILGERGTEVGEALTRAARGGPVGAILHRTSRAATADADRTARETYFLIPPRTGDGLRWPPGITDLSRTSRDEYLTVPALTGNTHPWAWWSPPTTDGDGVFVSPAGLHRVVCGLLNWRPGATS
jgi:hypothetical protein